MSILSRKFDQKAVFITIFAFLKLRAGLRNASEFIKNPNLTNYIIVKL